MAEIASVPTLLLRCIHVGPAAFILLLFQHPVVRLKRHPRGVELWLKLSGTLQDADSFAAAAAAAAAINACEDLIAWQACLHQHLSRSCSCTSSMR